MAILPMQEMGLLVPRMHHGSCAASKHLPLISNWGCIFILFCQQVLLWELLCSDTFPDASSLVPLRTEGQMGALLSPWANLHLHRGSRCFF